MALVAIRELTNQKGFKEFVPHSCSSCSTALKDASIHVDSTPISMLLPIEGEEGRLRNWKEEKFHQGFPFFSLFYKPIHKIFKRNVIEATESLYYILYIQYSAEAEKVRQGGGS
jgi:hypothetical protein